MATLYSKGTGGNWSTLGTFNTLANGTGTDTVPTGGSGGDDVTIQKNHTVSLDGTACVCKSLTLALGTTGSDVGGKLTADSTIDTKLVVHTSITSNGSNSGATFGAYSSIVDIDMSAASTKKCEIYTNGAAATSNAAAIDLAGKINLKGLTKTRWTLTNGALVGSDDGTGALTCDVDDATGWQVADKIVFATTQAFNATPKVDKVTIATITAVGGGAYSGTGAATITWTDGTGTGGALKYSHADNCLVGNLHSNLIFGPVVADQTFAMRVSCGARNTSAVINDVEFRSALAPVTFAWTGVLTLSGANGALSGISFSRNVFYDWTGIAVLGYLLDGDTPRNDNQFYSTKSVSNVFSAASPVGSPGDETDICVYRSTPGTTATYVASYAGTKLIDPKISGVTALGAISLSGGMGDAQVSGGGIWSCYSVAYKSSGTNPLCKFTDTYLGKGFPGSVYSTANNSYLVNGTGAGNVEFNNCLENLSGGSRANGTGGSPASETAFYNKNGVIADQEAYAVKYSGTTPVYVRDTGVTKNATASLRIDTIAAAAFSRTFDIPVKGGVAMSLFVYARKTGTFSTRPTAQLTGLGTSLPAVTMSTANNTWELLDLSYDAVDAPASDGLLTLTLSCQAASSLSAYFSGIPIPPWISRCRHYGSVVNETSATQVADPAIDPAISAATAAGYGGTGLGPVITWGATSNIATEADTTFKKLVHYTASQMIDNVGSALPITWAGAYNSPAIFAQGAINISGDTLNGPGSIDMGAHTLTATVPFAYTYTGGTFSQLTTVPTFAGGTLSPAAVLTSADAFTMSSGTVEMATTSTAWDLSGATFTGTLNLRTDTGSRAVTVLVPAGTTVDTTGESAITVNYTSVTRGLDFNGVVDGSTVKVFATGTQTVIATPTGPNWLWSESGGTDVTVDYTIQKAGYDPIRVTGVTVNSSVLPVAVQQQVARAYVASSGLTFDTNCFANPATKLFGLTAASTLQNFYSRMSESWITEATLQNKPFPIVPNGPNSFTLTDGWDWNLATYPDSIKLLSRDGMRQTNAGGNVTGMWAAILSVGVPAGKQVRFQQVDGSGTASADGTGDMDELVQILSDPNGDGSYADGYDRRGHLVLKVQADGYDQAEFDAVATYGALEDQFYVVGLAPTANGIAAAAVTGVTITDHGASPVTWNSKVFSITITDGASAHSGTELLQYVRGLASFNYHDLIRTNGAKFKTVRGAIYGDTGAALKGVRVLTNAGEPHPDFDLFTADDGTTYAPPVIAPIAWAGALDGTTCILYNDSNAGAIIDTQTVSGAGGYLWSISLPHADVAEGDALRLRYGNKSYYADELQGTMTASGLTFVGSMTAHPVYAGWGLDGAAYDQANGGPFTMDGANLQVDISAGATTGLKTQLGAWTQYLMTLPAGLDAFYGAWDLLALNQIRQNVAVVDVKIDVPTAGALFTFTDNNVNYYRSDFSYAGNVQTGHGLIAMTYDASPFVATVAGESVITGTPSSVAEAVRLEIAAELAAATNAEKFARNKQILDPATGQRTVFDNDGTTVLGQGNAYMDADGTIPYDGTGPVHRTDRLA